MKILVAMDSFKGSMTSLEAGKAAKQGILRADPEARIMLYPLADGGEGTVEAFLTGETAEAVETEVTGPLGEKVLCQYALIRKKGEKEPMTAVIEIAGAAGLTLIPKRRRDPMNTTTYGVGEVIRDALQRGCRRFIIGLGGSATNDGGAGMLQALGVKMLDREGKEIPHGARGLAALDKIEKDGLLPQLSECAFVIACDVKNTLCGENGCSRIFAPQKGASKEEIFRMDQWLSKYASMIKESFPDADPCTKGAGAAGGLGFAFHACLNGKMVSGAELLMQETGLLEKIRQADLVLTGEGCLDGQTVMGKAPVRVALEAKKYRKPVFAFAGRIGEGAVECLNQGITSCYCITPEGMPPAESMRKETALKNMEETVYRVLAATKVSGIDKYQL